MLRLLDLILAYAHLGKLDKKYSLVILTRYGQTEVCLLTYPLCEFGIFVRRSCLLTRRNLAVALWTYQ